MKDIRVLVRVIHWEDQIYRLLKKKKLLVTLCVMWDFGSLTRD